MASEKWDGGSISRWALQKRMSRKFDKIKIFLVDKC
jgi:hypothetical protein